MKDLINAIFLKTAQHLGDALHRKAKQVLPLNKSKGKQNTKVLVSEEERPLLIADMRNSEAEQDFCELRKILRQKLVLRYDRQTPHLTATNT